MRKKPGKAQGFLEYAVFIMVIAAALFAMRIYFARAIQEKYRQAGDVFGEGEQYQPGVTQTAETSNTHQ
ncbi:MAG: hypothetical protein PHG40_00645 [Candidatus Omnitrophica bacterium]|nr:hypothetical protein [Candidatus Omnitrophota bacterium]